MLLPQEVNSRSSTVGIGYLLKKLIKKRIFTFFIYKNIDYLDTKEENEKKVIEEDLKKILNKIKVGNEGFSFIYKNKENKFINDGKISEKYKDDCLREIIDKSKKIYSAKEYDFLSCGRGRYTVKTSYFKGFDWYFTVVVPEYEVKKSANDLIKKLIFIIVFTISFSIFIIFFLVSKVTKPLSILSKKISNVPEHDFTGDDHSELLDGLPVAAHNEAGQLARNFSFMIRELSGSIKHLVATTAANERIESELNAARKIQLDALPKDFSEVKQKGADLHAYLNPAREVGGDLYDFFFIDEDHFCFTVGDVADKGVQAALFMFWAKKMISSYAFKEGADRLSPAEIMREINEMLCRGNASATFITLFIGILNVKNGEMCYANGGHVSPIFVDCGSEPKYRKDSSGPAVGVRPGIRYKDITAVLQPGGAVFLCTDGVTEAMNEEDKLFGNKRLLDDFSCMKDKSCQEVVEGILYEVRRHAGTAPQSDDIAMLMVRRGAKLKDDEDYV
jgi:sigma-B regulation protein RsbU (phosphoserine phosphatase)